KASNPARVRRGASRASEDRLTPKGFMRLSYQPGAGFLRMAWVRPDVPRNPCRDLAARTRSRRDPDAGAERAQPAGHRALPGEVDARTFEPAVEREADPRPREVPRPGGREPRRWTGHGV